METIKSHAKVLIHARLSPAYILNDGKQTPMRGHPVFIAQHATATCCRGCLNKWYRVKEGVELTSAQEEKIVNLIMAWIEKEISSQ
jgi:exodeoxyribonuclease V alpha subunit